MLMSTPEHRQLNRKVFPVSFSKEIRVHNKRRWRRLSRINKEFGMLLV